MSKIFSKKTLMPVIVLGVICLVVAALMGGVNKITAPEIAEQEAKKAYASLFVVVDGDDAELMTTPENAPKSVTAMYKVLKGGTLAGYAVNVTAKGYAGNILMTVGVGLDGAVTKVTITSQSESHGKTGMASYPDKFAGVAQDKLADVELFSGATISSTAIKGGVLDAVNAVTGSAIAPPEQTPDEEKPPFTTGREEADVLARITALIAKDVALEDITPSYNKPESLMKLYKLADGTGYVAYVATPGQYVPVANEGLIYIDENGDIVSIDHFTWIVGNQISAEGFASGFVGRDLWSADGVELVTEATVTSGDFKSAVLTALDVVAKLAPRTDKKLLELVDELVPNSKSFELVELGEGAPETLKRVYKETSGKGYVAYIVTAGEYVDIATESLVYFDTEGNIEDMKILIWNVGHGIGYGDFDDRFVGLNKDSLDSVELVTAATGTSGDLKAAIIAAAPYIPTDFPIARVIGIAAVALAVIASVTVAIVIKKKRGGING